MAGPLRMEYPGAWHHVVNRGRRGEKICRTDSDREMFLEVLRESAEMWDLKVLAYCLMPNHYHLLIHSPDGNLGRGMRHLNGVYAQRFNRRRKIDGRLFRGRYRAVLIDADQHLLEVLRYIHRNPLRAGLAEALGDYRWSSHNGYVSDAL
jgi:putative transposase